MFKKWYFWVLMVFLGLIVAFLTVIFGLFFARPVVIIGGGEHLIQVDLEVVAEDPLKPVHLVLLGHGGAGHDGGGLADTIILAQIIPKQKRINLFNIPRDLWVELPFAATKDGREHMHAKVNTTLSIGNSERQYLWRPQEYQGYDGGGNLAKAVIGQIMGQTVDYYLSVDFGSFVQVIKVVAGNEGLKVDVPYSFVDEFYPIEGKEDDPCGYSEEDIASMSATLTGYQLEQQFTCRYERLEFQKGTQYISPEQLLKFARSRHSGSGGGDFGRSQRQQVVIEAVKERLFSPKILPKVPELISQILKYVRTDMDRELISSVLLAYDDIEDFEIESFVLTNKNLLADGRSSDGQYILRPRLGLDDYEQIQALVNWTLEATGEATLDDFLAGLQDVI